MSEQDIKYPSAERTHSNRENQGRTKGTQPSKSSSSRNSGKPKSTNNHNRKHQEQGEKSPSKEGLEFGLIVSFKDTFGFIQPFSTEEDIYFSARDAPSDIKIRGEVQFFKIKTPRGLCATNVSYTIQEEKCSKEMVLGTIVREADAHRGPFGLIELPSLEENKMSSSSPKYAPYFYEDIIPGDNQKKTLKKGDTVLFTVMSLPGTGYCRGKEVRLHQMKRDKAVQDVQKLIATGHPAHQGHIESLHSDYGFIRSAEGNGVQFYFRMDDVQEKNGQLLEGADVEFYVIDETSRGKNSDRAVHIKVLPAGTVQLETTLATAVLGTVITEPKHHPHETPGIIRLQSPLSVEGHPQIEQVELWARCCHEGFLCRAGDSLTLDVTHYRPENLFFARNVSVFSFRKVGREHGRICRVKDQGFGFLHSSVREVDIYFRTNEVVGPDGRLMRESAVVQDMLISYDVVVEETSRNAGSNARLSLRAVRVQVVDGLGTGESAHCRTILKRTGVQGLVIREAKKEVPGLIKPYLSAVDLIPNDEDLMMDIVEGITEFNALPLLREVVIENLVPAQRRLYYMALDKQFFNVAYETLGSSDSKTRSIRIWKLNDSDYIKWRTTKVANPKTEIMKDKVGVTGVPGTGGQSSLTGEDGSGVLHLFFQKSDVNSEVGPVVRDREVTFDVHLDKRTGRMVARSVSLTDFPASGVDGESANCTGVVDLAKNGKTGFIRVLVTDEKLVWQPTGQPVAVETTGEKVHLSDGKEVSFEVRVRGGVRCAMNVKPLVDGTLRKREVVEGVCTALVLSETHVVLADVTACPLLSSKYLDLVKAAALLGKGASGKPWTHVSLTGNTTGSTAKESSSPSTAGASHTSDSCQNGKSGTGDRKFYGTLLRTPVLIMKSAEEKCKYAVGSLVTCRAVVDWALQRSPIGVTDLCAVAVDNLPVVATRRKGTIIKAKLPLSLDSSSEHLFMHQIIEAINESTGFVPGEVGHFFLDSREAFGHNKGELRRGDVVQFFAIPGTRVAVAVSYLGTGAAALTPPPATSAVSANTVSPGGKEAGSKDGDGGIVFKRTPVNAELKKSNITGGVRGVTMAQGPPDSGTTGFVTGWREQLDTSALPWGHLLPH